MNEATIVLVGFTITLVVVCFADVLNRYRYAK